MIDTKEKINFDEWIKIVKSFAYYATNNIIEVFVDKSEFDGLSPFNISNDSITDRYFQNLGPQYEHIAIDDYGINSYFEDDLSIVNKTDSLPLKKVSSINTFVNQNNEKNNDTIYYFKFEITNKLKIENLNLEGIIEKYGIKFKFKQSDDLKDSKSNLVNKLKATLKSIKSSLNLRDNYKLNSDNNFDSNLSTNLVYFSADDLSFPKSDKEFIDERKIFYKIDVDSYSESNNSNEIDDNVSFKKIGGDSFKTLRINRYKDKFGVIDIEYSYIPKNLINENIKEIRNNIENSNKKNHNANSINSNQNQINIVKDSNKIEDSFVIIDKLADNSNKEKMVEKPINLIENFYSNLENDNGDQINKRDRSGSECINLTNNNILNGKNDKDKISKNNKNEQQNDNKDDKENNDGNLDKNKESTLFTINDNKQKSESEIYLTKKPSNRETPTPKDDLFVLKESSFKTSRNINNISEYYNYYNDLISKNNDFTIEDYKVKLNILDKVHSKMKQDFIIWNETTENDECLINRYDNLFNMSEIKSNIRTCKDSSTNDLVENVIEKYNDLKILFCKERELQKNNNLNLIANNKVKTNMSFKRVISKEFFNESNDDDINNISFNTNMNLNFKKSESINKTISFEKVFNNDKLNFHNDKNYLKNLEMKLQKARENKDLLTFIKLKFKKNHCQ